VSEVRFDNRVSRHSAQSPAVRAPLVPDRPAPHVEDDSDVEDIYADENYKQQVRVGARHEDE
jgi:hypothetical protein